MEAEDRHQHLAGDESTPVRPGPRALKADKDDNDEDGPAAQAILVDISGYPVPNHGLKLDKLPEYLRDTVDWFIG